jgi:peptide/nickel transport system substrate-binding protein
MRPSLQNVLAASAILAGLNSGGILLGDPAAGSCYQTPSPGDFLRVAGESGVCGGRIVVSQRSEPRTLNPIVAADVNSQRIINLLNADLIHINHSSFQTEPCVAKAWTVSPDGRTYKLALRRNLQFSDGFAFNADDVVFSYETYLNESLHSPQRDMLLVSGKPIKIRKADAYTVVFELPAKLAAGDRIFDGVAILPRHILQSKTGSGELLTTWGVNTDPKQIVGLGPFRLKAFVPGRKIVLERNPFYWKIDAAGKRLPYLDEIISETVPNSEAEALRFLSGETDVMTRMTAANYSALKPKEQERNFRLYDLGPGLEYTFLFFNLNAPSPSTGRLKQEQEWFQQVEFRNAVEQAVDRESIVRLAYRGHAAPISVPMSTANSTWLDRNIPHPTRSLSRARELLRKVGFTWSRDGLLHDAKGKAVAFSLLVNTANPQQQEIGILLQQDLKDLGIQVTLNTLEFRSFLQRIFSSLDYDAAILSLADGDADPNTELSLFLSTGSNHVWSLKAQQIPDWQKEIDALMQRQLTTRAFEERKRYFDQAQEMLWRNKPAIFLISPNVLVGAKKEIGNFRPAKLQDSALWNADQLFNRRLQRTSGR